MTLKEKMAGGEIYFCSDPELVAEQENAWRNYMILTQRVLRSMKSVRRF